MSVELGHFALALALALALCQTLLPFAGARLGDARLMRAGLGAALGQFAMLALAFAALAEAHLRSDFSVLNVAENSHSELPAIYKFAGVWGNHEGSMLLWSLILATFGALVAVFGRGLPMRLRADALAVQGLMGAAFLAFTILTSNPFERLFPAPLEGRDLNPVLQDPGLAIHPPLLYLGYVGFSIVFSFAAAALIEGRIDAAWARFVRPFALLAWSFLTLGIAMGSYWAYYTLGWGGFWFWDPVENASLMPWLAGTAFIHSAAVMEKREALKVWTIFLAILAFSFSLLGTFLVRSGVLTSVHAFANDPRRGVFILAILFFFIVGALGLFAWRAPLLKTGGLFAPISREGALVLNNLLIATSCFAVMLGTLYPLALEQLTGEKITVGAPFFNLTCGALMLAAAFALPFGNALAWKRGDLLGVAQRLSVALGAGVAAGIVTLAATSGASPLAALAAGLAIFILLGVAVEIATRALRSAAANALSRALGFPLSFWGSSLAHMGFGLGLLGLAMTGLGAEKIASMKVGEPVSVGPYLVLAQGVQTQSIDNYTQTEIQMSVRAGGREVARIAPARRKFVASGASTTEAGIVTLDFGQIYVSVGDPDANGTIPARLYWKPLVTFIWLGALLMAAGGGLSLADRRLRIGVARSRQVGRGGSGMKTWLALLRTWAAIAFIALAPSAFAVQPDEVLSDPTLEAQARALSAQLRCMVCQNQSIDDSDAPLAKDIRVLIRERLVKGESVDQIRDFLVSRYGDFILLKPPFNVSTLLLWLGAPLALGLAALAMATLRKRGTIAAPPLTSEEEQELAKMRDIGAARRVDGA